jgi:hypothetical protein
MKSALLSIFAIHRFIMLIIYIVGFILVVCSLFANHKEKEKRIKQLKFERDFLLLAIIFYLVCKTLIEI